MVRVVVILWWMDWVVMVMSCLFFNVGMMVGWCIRVLNVVIIWRMFLLFVIRMVSMLYKEIYWIVGEIDFIELGFISYLRFG